MTRLEQATRARLQEIAAFVHGGATEHTGRPVRIYDPEGRVVEYGRRVRGGTSLIYPELERTGDSPAVTAAAIERGKGVRFDRIYRAVRQELSELYPEHRRGPERPIVSPHRALSQKCKTCGVYHGKGAHRFHGKGSFHKTHLWGFTMPNPKKKMTLRDAVALFNQYAGKRLTANDYKRLQAAAQVIRRSRKLKINPVKSTKKTLKPAKVNGGAVRIGRIVEIRYLRDQGRKRGLYFHKFHSRASLWTMPDGSIVVR